MLKILHSILKRLGETKESTFRETGLLWDLYEERAFIVPINLQNPDLLPSVSILSFQGSVFEAILVSIVQKHWAVSRQRHFSSVHVLC